MPSRPSSVCNLQRMWTPAIESSCPTRTTSVRQPEILMVGSTCYQICPPSCGPAVDTPLLRAEDRTNARALRGEALMRNEALDHERAAMSAPSRSRRAFLRLSVGATLVASGGV